MIAVALALWVKPSYWGHRPWANAYNGSPVTGELKNPATYFLVQKPLAFVIRSFPRGSRFYQLSDADLPILKGAQLNNRIRAGLANPLPGGNWVILMKGDSIPTDLLKPYSLEADDLCSCITLPGVLAADLDVCPLRQSQSGGTR